nr:Imm27 family immunity protein [uncultured Devosia sp.]
MTERWIEEFLLKGSTVLAIGDAAKIDAMLRDELVKVRDEDEGWTNVYRHRTNGTFWKLTYPNGAIHGGGPRQLIELSSVMPVPRTDLIAEVRFYSSEVSGKTQPVFSGYGCPCMVSTAKPWTGWDARLVFEGGPIHPGQKRGVGFAFLTQEGAQTISKARHFFLWEGRVVGEASKEESLDSMFDGSIGKPEHGIY